ncbi:MAG: hypothetical protein RQM92_07465 [Candidatus Syntrophopropionicum ammoniitolerans]
MKLPFMVNACRHVGWNYYRRQGHRQRRPNIGRILKGIELS